MRTEKGFTLIELMIVVVIIGILAAIAIPNFIAMQNRAKEGSTKANMHTLQLAAEDYGVRNDGVYAADMTSSGSPTVAASLPASFKNPFDATTGPGNPFEAALAGAREGRDTRWYRRHEGCIASGRGPARLPEGPAPGGEVPGPAAQPVTEVRMREVEVRKGEGSASREREHGEGPPDP